MTVFRLRSHNTFGHHCSKRKSEKHLTENQPKLPYIPVMLSHRIRDVMIRPYGANNDSKSGWVIFFGKPETYKLAPLMASELGRAKETYKLNAFD